MKRRILIVDDNRGYGEVLGRFFARQDFIVSVEVSPLEALAAAPEFSPHFVLVDFDMPELNGSELLRLLLALPGLANIRCLCLTSDPAAARAPIAATNPACPVLDKSAALSVVLEHVKALLAD